MRSNSSSCKYILSNDFNPSYQKSTLSRPKLPFIYNIFKNKNDKIISIYAAIISSIIFFCFCGYRRPWAAGTWTYYNESNIDKNYKMWLTISQFIGFFIGKIFGATYLVSLNIHKRYYVLIGLPFICTIAWSFIYIFPFHFIIAMISLFIIGLVLAWAWPCLYLFLEGRNGGDILACLMTFSFTAGTGVAKAIGAFLLEKGIHLSTMPFLTSLFYLVPVLFFIYLIKAVPSQSNEEKIIHSKRSPMTKQDKINHIKKYWPGLFILIILELITGCILMFRDLFFPEIWMDIHNNNIKNKTNTQLYLTTELPVCIAIACTIFGLSFIKKNYISVIIQHLLFIVAAIILVISQIIYDYKLITSHIWYILIGYGVFIIYLPLISILPDRLFGAIQAKGTVAFQLCLSSLISTGGIICMLLFKVFITTESEYNNNNNNNIARKKVDINYLDFFSLSIYVIGILCIILPLLSLSFWQRYFVKNNRKELNNTINNANNDPVIVN